MSEAMLQVCCTHAAGTPQCTLHRCCLLATRRCRWLFSEAQRQEHAAELDERQRAWQDYSKETDSKMLKTHSELQDKLDASDMRNQELCALKDASDMRNQELCDQLACGP